MTRAGRVAGMCAAALSVAAMAGPAGERGSNNVPDDGQDFVVHHFDQRHVLTLDTSRIAVRRSAGDGGMELALQAIGMGDRPARSWAADRWALVELPADERDAASVRDSVAASSEVDEATYVSPVFIDTFGNPMIVTPAVLVRFEPGVAADDAEHVLKDHRLDTIEHRDWARMAGAYVARCDDCTGLEVLSVANALAQRDDVIFAEPDMLFTGRGGAGGPDLPDDPFFAQLWGLHNTGQHPGCGSSGPGKTGVDVDALDGWSLTDGDSSVIVAVLDDGVQLDHPDLSIDPALGEDFTGQDGGGWPVNECDRHGTAVAGCAGSKANNGLGAAGVAPGCSVASARSFISNQHQPCDSTWFSQASWTVNALAWAESVGARVTNNSNAYGFKSSAIDSMYAETRDAGMVHFASAGNDGAEWLAYPASLGSVNAIAALRHTGEPTSFSNFGQGLAFTAPGEFIITTDRTGGDGYVGGDYTCFNGTSAASPYAAGVAALVLAADPDLPADDVEAVLEESATDLGEPGYDTTFGWGLPNAAQSIEAVGPANSVCASAEVISDGVTEFNTTLAGTDGPPEPSSCPFADGQVYSDLWFVYEATCTGEVSISMCETGFSAVLTVYGEQCPEEPGSALACDHESCPETPQPALTMSVEAGEVMHLRVGGVEGEKGEGALVVSCDSAQPGDLTGDGAVDGADLGALLGAWGECPDANPCPADLNGDGVVDSADLGVLLSHWGD